MARSRIHPLAALRRFARARRGATAVEFALVALPFVMLLFGIMELAAVFLASATLDLATDRAARLIRTGEFQTSGATSKSAFKSEVCSRMSWLSGACNSNLIVDVQTFANFTDAANAGQPTADQFKNNTTCFTTGTAGDIVLVRAYYTWTLTTPLLDGALDNTGDGKRRIMAIATFRNEPYSSDIPVGAAC
ncbi:TadE/TadG family type IV pilus assembly protein [Phenylobacterium sp.]|uniref:TadE/TadG family type IV pilus assembly protein n=1 Tax=Phenylobacterium sp. TaxID=1871053 RepID=UPI0035B2E73E